MNYATIKYYDIANGPGVRTSIFVSGCRHHCPGCFNEVAWDFGYGQPFDKPVRNEVFASCKPDYITGLSLLGGEPMEPENQRELVTFVQNFKALYPKKTVAFFYINTSGAAVVRNPEDYISNMIELGGARNAFRDLQDDSGKTSVPITMEQFYDTAEDADYLIYNASIDSTVKTLDDLLAKDSMFADYKAVKEGNVWTTEKSMYQATDKIAQFTNDINLLVTGGDPDQMVFLRKLS